MTYLYLFSLIALAMAAGSILLALRDGRGPSRPPRSHHDDVFTPPQLLSR